MDTKKRTWWNDGWTAVLIVLAVLVIDQVLKIWVKTHMTLHESIEIASWFKITFIENNGMAFGMEIGSKIFLTAFRVLAVGALSYYIWLQVAQRARTGYVVLLSMILAGAMGNLIDCLFYGQIFTVSTPYNIAEFVSFGQGYAPVMMGKVVDMFYFPLIETTWPTWIPVVGGQEFVFFSPVFNFADANVSVGIIALLLFYRNELSHITFSKSHPIDADDEVQE
ncbi:MAG: lipoprotein signal peptidase [Prevotella sp.]|nr:lipoprotein signal peptidase [Prevotella sp.]